MEGCKLNYGKYKNARNASWQCLLDFKIDKLPVLVTDIIYQCNNIRLIKDSHAKILADKSGMTLAEGDVFTIIYKDTEPS